MIHYPWQDPWVLSYRGREYLENKFIPSVCYLFCFFILYVIPSITIYGLSFCISSFPRTFHNHPSVLSGVTLPLKTFTFSLNIPKDTLLESLVFCVHVSGPPSHTDRTSPQGWDRVVRDLLDQKPEILEKRRVRDVEREVWWGDWRMSTGGCPPFLIWWTWRTEEESGLPDVPPVVREDWIGKQRTPNSKENGDFGVLPRWRPSCLPSQEVTSQKSSFNRYHLSYLLRRNISHPCIKSKFCSCRLYLLSLPLRVPQSFLVVILWWGDRRRTSLYSDRMGL